MIRTVIIDDEAHIRDTLTKLLARYCPDVEVIGEASGAGNGIEMIRKLKPDVILLDIQLGDGTGYELLRTFNEIDFKVIFISSFDRKSILAFKLSSLEYLQKPINPVDLTDVMNRVMKSEIKYFPFELQALEENMEQ